MKQLLLISILLGVELLACQVRAQGPEAAADTVEVPTFTFTKEYTGRIKGNVSQVSMENKFDTKYSLPNGWKGRTGISVLERNYRLQDRRDQTRTFTSNLTMPLRPGVIGSFLLSDNRFFNRIINFSSESQDFKNDGQRASGSLTYIKVSPNGSTFDASATAALSRTEQTFQSQNGQEGSGRAAIKYVIGDRITIAGSGYLRKTAEKSKTATTVEEGLGTDEDSLTAYVGIAITDSASVSADYARFTSTREFLDQPRGAFQQAQLQADLQSEIETRSATNASISAVTKPVRGVTLNMSAEHTESETDFVNAPNRFESRTRDVLSGRIGYVLGKTSTDFTLENSKTFNNFNSLATFTDERRSIRANLNHSFTSTFNFAIQSGLSLLQNKYDLPELNPRDRDQQGKFANIRFNSSPFPKVTATAYMSINQTDFVNIDASLAQNNRLETTWNFRPELTYQLTQRIRIRQTYSLNLELTEFRFTENDNFLDRTVSFANTIDARLSDKLTTELYYQLRLHDRGSYLSQVAGGERFLDIATEDRRDQMRISFRYEINEHFTLLGENDYSRREDETVGSSTIREFTDGGLEIGIESNYEWAPTRKLSLRLIKVNRFGQFNAVEQEDYWLMDSSLTYAF